MSDAPPASLLLAQTREIVANLEAVGTRYMLSGGIVVNIHG